MSFEELANVTANNMKAITEANKYGFFNIFTGQLTCEQCGKCTTTDEPFKQVLGVIMYASMILDSYGAAVEKCCDKSKDNEILDEYNKIFKEKYNNLLEVAGNGTE